MGLEWFMGVAWAIGVVHGGGGGGGGAILVVHGCGIVVNGCGMGYRSGS